jgi:hypothetical protein
MSVHLDWEFDVSPTDATLLTVKLSPSDANNELARDLCVGLRHTERGNECLAPT